MQAARLFLVVWTMVTRALSGSVLTPSQPLDRRDGDFVIVGIFDIGNLNEGETECVLTDSDVYPLEKALVFQDLMRGFTSVESYTIGYEIYPGCHAPFLTHQISSKAALNEKVIGFLASDWAVNVRPSIGSPASFFIPTIGYIYSEDAFLEKKQYPTYLSLIETEEMEAQSIISLLKFLEAKYVDIWYNSGSESVARYVYQNYVLQKSGGRYIKFDGRKDTKAHKATKYDNEKFKIKHEFEEYDINSKVPEAPIQLLLFNGNQNHVIPFLNETIHTRKWKNKTYIFGYTVSRDHYREISRKILDDEILADVENEIFIYLRSEVQNANLRSLQLEGGLLYDRAKAADDSLSEHYNELRKCNFDHPAKDLASVCENKKSFTSWMSFVATATQILINNLGEVLPEMKGDIDIFDLRKKLFARMESGTHEVQIYDDYFVNDIRFLNSTLAKGYEVIEYRRTNTSSEEMKRGVVFYNHSLSVESLVPTLKDHVRETGGGEPCAPDCPAGSHIALMSHYSGLTSCWTCHPCTAATVSSEVNSKQCTECEDDEYPVEGNTACEPVLKNFISLKSPQFIVGLSLSVVAVVITVSTAVFIFVHQDRPVIKASDHVFCYLFLSSLCLGDLLTVLTLLEPSTLTCNAEFYICALFVCCVCTNLFYRSLKIFMTAANFDLRRPFIFKFLTRPAQCVILVVMMVVTALLTMVSIMHQGWEYQEALDPHISIHKVCTSANFLATCYPFIIPCVFLGATLLIAYKMRLFPHNFKETTTIFTTCLMIVVICLMFLSGYSVSEPAIKSMLRAVVFFSISQSFLLCFFLPKIVILLKMDDLIAGDDLSSAIQTFCEADDKRKEIVAQQELKKKESVVEELSTK